MKLPVKFEYFETKVKILEETLDEKDGKSTLKVQVKWQQADKINNNGRSYPKQTLSKEIDRIEEAIASGQVVGSAYHPSGGDAETVDVSHKWDKIWMTPEGECLGNATIIPTKNGKEVMTLIKSGVHPALSSRGYGTVTRKSKKVDGKVIPYDEVNKDFKLISPGDFVLSPSVPDARIRAIIESNHNKDIDSEINQEEKETMNFDEKNKALADEFPDENKSYLETVVATALEKEKKVWEKEHKEAIDVLEVKLTEFSKKYEELEKKYKALAETIAEMNTVVNPPAEGDEDPQHEDNKDDEIAKLNTRIDAMEKEKADAKKAKEDADTTAKLQVDLKAAVETELEKDEYKPYKSMLEKELITDSGVDIESVEKVEEEVKTTFTRLQTLFAEAKKEGIVKKDLTELGRIENPEGGEEELSEKEEEAKINAAFEYAKKTGSSLTKKEFVEKVYQGQKKK
jgi:hypothetical protein